MQTEIAKIRNIFVADIVLGSVLSVSNHNKAKILSFVMSRWSYPERHDVITPRDTSFLR